MEYLIRYLTSSKLKIKFYFIYIIIFFILIMKFRNINFFKHFIINDQYKLDIVDRLVNCKTIKCNYVHYFMIIRIIYSLIWLSPAFCDCYQHTKWLHMSYVYPSLPQADHRYLWTGPYTMPLIAHPPIFYHWLIFMYTTFCNFLCITVWHIYNKYNQTVVSIHTGFLTYS